MIWIGTSTLGGGGANSSSLYYYQKSASADTTPLCTSPFSQSGLKADFRIHPETNFRDPLVAVADVDNGQSVLDYLGLNLNQISILESPFNVKVQKIRLILSMNKVSLPLS